MWEGNDEPGARYFASTNGYNFECTKNGDVYKNTDDAGWYDTGEETWDFDCDVERFIWEEENDGEELKGVDAGDEEVDAEQNGEDVSSEEEEGTNVDYEEDGDDAEDDDAYEGGGEDDEYEDEEDEDVVVG